MGLEELKARAHDLIEHATTEKSLTNAIKELEEDIPFVTPEQEERILKGIKEMEEGKGIPAEEVIARLRARRERRNAA